YAPLIKEAEGEIEEIDQKIESALGERNKKEKEEVDIYVLIKSAIYLMEHLEVLLLQGSDPFKRAILFSLAFDGLPTYGELKNGTPRLSPLFKLNYDFKRSKKLSGGTDGN
ncbi:MAG: hypothetical protein Q7R43_01025, partial [Candidatus Daviesbacteria bacterium]|nr:hypothetical protein [Candidatus Daviesbacteria bacterium]